MSLKTFLQEIKDAVEKFFNELDPELKKALDLAIKIVNAIKTWDDSNPLILDFITSLIEGNIDDEILAEIRIWLPKILIELRLIDSEITDPNGAVLSATKVIQSLPTNVKNTILNSLAQLLAETISKGELTWEYLVYLVKGLYDKIK